MGAAGWSDLLALLTSVGFGVLSAVIPLANAEAYVVASQMSRTAGPVAVALGIGLGQTIGKVLLFLSVRRGRRSRFLRHRRAELRRRPAGPLRRRGRVLLAQLLALVGRERWGLPITLVAALLGLPPLYAVALLAGATRMRMSHFAAVVLVGRSARFVLVAYGVDGLRPWSG